MVNGGVYIKRLIEDGAMKEDFQIELLGIYSKEECLERETRLAMTTLFPKGLNGNAGRHIEMTEEVRRKMSAAHLGMTYSDEIRAKNSAARKGEKNPNYGKKHTEETKAKISAAKKGKTRSDEIRAKISAASKGMITALNIETGIVKNIPTELYRSRRDIYFHNRSKVFQNWKLNHSKK